MKSLSKTQQKQHADLSKRLREADDKLTSALDTYNELAREAQSFVEEVAS